MKITVKARPAAKENKVERLADGTFIVSVTEPPVQGRANEAIIQALADFLHIAPSHVRMISGHTRRQKVIEVY